MEYLIDRKVWTKDGKKGISIRKIITLKTSKSEIWDGWPEWIIFYSDFSLGTISIPTLSYLGLPIQAADLVKKWFFQFLNRNQRWIAKYDHNQLRITRAIRSLRLLVGDIEADNFRQSIFDYLGEDVDLIGEKAKSFWKSA